MAAQQATIPVSQNERATILDSLRGFALLGVLLDNLFMFSGWILKTEEQMKALPTWQADRLLWFAEFSFIHGKFYSLFSLLFGIGFAIILMHTTQRGANGLKIFYRRLLVLFIIGLLHCLFIWEGDILLLYAMLGMLLPLFRKCSDKTLLIWAVAFILSPILIDAIRIAIQTSPGNILLDQAAAIDKKNNLPTDPAIISQYLYTGENAWQHWRNWMEPGFFYRYGDLLNSNRLPKVLGMFLFGFYAGRKMMFTRLQEYSNFFRQMRKWGLLVGLPLSFASFYFEINKIAVPKAAGITATIFYALSVAPLALAYASWFCLHWQKAANHTHFKWLAPLGRMALTNYLVQTALGILIYYQLGLGAGGNIGPAIFIPLGLAVYLFQILFSMQWLKYFNYGPVEWIWRMLTYGKYLPLRKHGLTDKKNHVMNRIFLLMILLLAIATTLQAQLTEHAISKEKWSLYGQVKTIGVAKASLEYKANTNDSIFILLLEDERKELKNFFSIRFNSTGNTVNNLYGILISFFEKDNWKNKAYTKIFTLGNSKVMVYKATGLVQQKAIIISTDEGRIRLTKNEINQLFNK